MRRVDALTGDARASRPPVRHAVGASGRRHSLLAWKVEVQVAEPRDLLATMRASKTKHGARMPWMDEIVARAERGDGPAGLEAP